MRNAAPVVAVLVLLVGLPARLSGQAPLEPDGYTRWLLTVPADTKVRIKTDFGNFLVPIGYLTTRHSFRQNPMALNHGVARFDVGQELSWRAVPFNYWVPDGGMVWHSAPNVRTNRPIEPGHMRRTRESFVVMMFGAGSVHNPNWTARRARLSPSPKQLDVVLPAQSAYPRGLHVTSHAYEGATRDRDDKLVRFFVECYPHFQLCEGWFIIDRRELALWVLVPKDALDFMFDAVRVAARLLDEWEEAAQ